MKEILRKNKLGGVNDMSDEALKRAKHADIITMPKGVEGTNCYNCMYIKDPETGSGGSGYCTNEYIKQYVNKRMCCSLWDKSGTYRPYGKQAIELK